MSNDSRVNLNFNMLPGGIKIKTEPGTSRFNVLQDNVSIKIEPGTSQRLTSLKLPRDLKLGGSKSKVFKPNLNVVRNKKTESASPVNQNARGRNRGRGRGSDRGRGAPRGRNSQNTVQSYGVFSEGVAETMVKRTSDRFREEKDYDSSKMIERPTINKNIEWKVDKDHEETMMKELLNVNFAPGEELENDIHPIILPVNKNIETKPVVKMETFIKTEEKPLENGTMDTNLFQLQDKLMLFQFPDTLPGIGPSNEPEPTKPNTSTSTNTNDTNPEAEKTPTENKCTLRDINEGLLGKIVIYKSGKTKLVIGNTKFDIEIGPAAGFLQDVMSVPVNTTTNTGDMINLGSLEGHVVVTPEWDTLLRDIDK